jgi:hypothetical protein
MSTTEQRNIIIAIVGIACSITFYNFTNLPTYQKGGLSLISTLVISYVIISIMGKKDTENYGGPIRVTRKIPMTDCYKFCDNNYGMCAHMYPQDNVHKCNSQWRACRAECYFPNVQRF